MTQIELHEIFKQHQAWLNSSRIDGRRADLSFCNLKGLDLSNVNLRGALLEGANLTGADLSYSDLSGAYLRYVNLSHAYLRSTNLSGADLECANLKGANLREADLTDTGIYFFKGPKDRCIYDSKDDKLYISCQDYNLDYWLENYADIGRKYEYTDEEIEEYGQLIKSLKSSK